MLKVIKKDNTTEIFTPHKIKKAVGKAAFRCDKRLTEDQMNTVVNTILDRLGGRDEVSVTELHELVIASLNTNLYRDVADSYAEYRYYKNNYAKTFEKLRQDADDVLRLGDRENANFDSSLVSTKGSLIKGYLTKSLYKQFYLANKEKELIDRGDIYIHDLRDLILGCINCCLFDVETVMKNGFEMSNVQYTEPKSVLSALQLIGDITLVATAQQFGGFTLSEIDKVLLPYVYKSFNKFNAKYTEIGVVADVAETQAINDTIRELEQGFQSLELKLNTVPCSRGDFAFTTLTFGHFDNNYTEQDRFWISEIGKAILKVRRNGHGKDHKPVVFPKLVFLFDHTQYENTEDVHAQSLFDCAVLTSSKCMYPDWLAINAEYGTVSRLYKEQGVITSPMGCRAYLSPWKNEQGKYVTIGRCNIGAVSLNLPLILKATQLEYPDCWAEKFWEQLADRMQVIREFFKKRYDVIRHQKASSNPLAFTQGGFYEGFLQPDDEVGDLVRYMTASFGVTAFDEFTYLWSGKRMVDEGGNLANKVLQYMKALVDTYKEQDGYLYALYGTPAESLCQTQAKQYDAFCKQRGIENVFLTTPHYSSEYFTNSFHINVTEDITPFQKQDLEFKAFHNCEGGHIQYVRVDNPENLQAVKALILRGMKDGFYQGVNFDIVFCNECGHVNYNGSIYKCSKCGSSNVTTQSRVCGYLGYSNVNGHSRMNDGKMEEINNRVSM